MSITTEAELETAITNWLGGRTDLTARYPEWITLFEAHAARRLKVMPMEVQTGITFNSGSAILPTDFLGLKELLNPNNQPLQYATETYLDGVVGQQTGTSAYFTIVGDNTVSGTQFLVSYPKQDGSYTITYFAKTPALSGTLNWLFTNFPDAYLWGALTEAHAFVADDQMLAIAKARRDEIMDEVSKLYSVRMSPLGTRIQVLGVTP